MNAVTVAISFYSKIRGANLKTVVQISKICTTSPKFDEIRRKVRQHNHPFILLYINLLYTQFQIHHFSADFHFHPRLRVQAEGFEQTLEAFFACTHFSTPVASRQPLLGACRLPLTLQSGVPAASTFYESLADADDAALMRLCKHKASKMVTLGHRNAKGDLKTPQDLLFSLEDSNVVFFSWLV